MRKLTTMVGAGAVALAAATAAVAATVVVSPGHLNGWQAVHDSCGSTSTNTGSQGFALGPVKPPAGRGSYRLTVGSNGASNETFRSRVLDGRRLTEITALRYWSYEARFGSEARAVYLRLAVDLTGNGDVEDTLTFQPSDQASVKLNTWQSWDALRGSWRSDHSVTPTGRLVTLAQYASLYPNVRVAKDGGGSLRIGAGCGGAAWSGFTGYADAVAVGAAAVSATNPVSTGSPNPTTPGSGKAPSLSTTFDFEPSGTLVSPGRKPQNPRQGDAKVAMCHNGHTIRVDRHAVKAHLRQGDKMGACSSDHDGDHGDGDHGDGDHGDGGHS